MSHSKKPKASKQKEMMIRAMSKAVLWLMSQKIASISLKSTSLNARTTIAPILEYTQILKPKGRTKMPKSVKRKIPIASIESLYLF